MAVKIRNGFQLSTRLGGGNVANAQRFQKATNQGENSVIRVGDPIALTSAGTVARYPANFSGATANTRVYNWLGVATGIYEDQNGRPLTHRTVKHSVTADTHWVDVITDPDAVYEVSYGATANQTVIGSLAYVQYETSAGNVGLSRAGLMSSQPAATALQAGLRIIDIVNLDQDGFTNDQDGRVKVIAADHVYRNSDPT